MTEKRNSAGQVDEVVLTRVLDAPRGLVFKAWTDPTQVSEWWGPQRFTNKLRKWEARPGGKIDLDMIGPDGAVYPMAGAFRELQEPEKLVFESCALDAHGKPMFEILNTITLVASGSKTILTVTARVVTQGPNTEQYLKGMEAGWAQSLDKLDGLISPKGGSQK